MPAFPSALLLLAALLAATPSPAQQPAGDDAQRLLQSARAAREQGDRSISAYTALVRNRTAFTLRLPVRDRLLDREESVARVRWMRGADPVVQLLGSRESSGSGVEVDFDWDDDRVFDPGADRMYFGSLLQSDSDRKEDDSFWIAHPLAAGSESVYRFATGDTVAVRLPDGSTVRAVEIRVTPIRPSFHTMSGALWIEPESGALVQAVYRPSRKLDVLSDTTIIDADDRDGLKYLPGFARPLEVDVESVVVQYALWDLKHWLPRSTRVEANARAGSVRFVLATEMSYEFEEVLDGDQPPLAPAEALTAMAGDTAGLVEVKPRRGERRPGSALVYRPRDEDLLLKDDRLPPPIWDRAPEFLSPGELDALGEQLRDIAGAAAHRGPPELSVEWGTGGPGLARFNRVEGLSLGARARVALGPYELAATGRLGVGDLHPGVELIGLAPLGARRVEVEGYHRLATVVGTESALGTGNSLGALLLGRDAGEYFRATGARLSLLPPAAARQTLRLSLFAEAQRAAERGTRWSLARLAGGDGFRPNLEADPAELVGVALLHSPWWGRDPRRAQVGLETLAEGASGSHQYARARLTARSVLPLGPTTRLGVEASAADGWGDAPVQSHWFLGGPETLRGYPHSIRSGPAALRGRAELARGARTGAIILFGDAGWAGRRADFDPGDLLASAGVGLSLLDGIVRLDLARALVTPTGWRLELYLDALM